jgi:hypothetical protein
MEAAGVFMVGVKSMTTKGILLKQEQNATIKVKVL